MNQENTFTVNGRRYHIIITPFMKRQLDDLASEKRNVSAIIAAAVNRLHANMVANMQRQDVEVMPEGEPLPALCSLWQARQQEVVKLALFDAWREWSGMP